MPSLCLYLEDCGRDYQLKFDREPSGMDQKFLNMNNHLVPSNQDYICQTIDNMVQHMKTDW